MQGQGGRKQGTGARRGAQLLHRAASSNGKHGLRGAVHACHRRLHVARRLVVLARIRQVERDEPRELGDEPFDGSVRHALAAAQVDALQLRATLAQLFQGLVTQVRPLAQINLLQLRAVLCPILDAERRGQRSTPAEQQLPELRARLRRDHQRRAEALDLAAAEVERLQVGAAPGYHLDRIWRRALVELHTYLKRTPGVDLSQPRLRQDCQPRSRLPGAAQPPPRVLLQEGRDEVRTRSREAGCSHRRRRWGPAADRGCRSRASGWLE